MNVIVRHARRWRLRDAQRRDGRPIGALGERCAYAISSSLLFACACARCNIYRRVAHYEGSALFADVR